MPNLPSQTTAEALEVHHLTWAQHAQIWVMRMHRSMGAAGWVGMGLLLVSAVIGGALSKWDAATVPMNAIAPPPPQAAPADNASSSLALPSLSGPLLRSAAEAPTVIKQLARTVQNLGLSCPHADYKIVPITNIKLGQLEGHLNLKGPYPKVRALVDKLLDDEPGLAIKELSLQRANTDAVEVEAKLQFVVYLSDGWSDRSSKAAISGVQQ